MSGPAYIMAVLFSAHKEQDMLDEEIYSSVAELLADWSDDRKADLYARLQERIDPLMSFTSMQQAIQDCFDDNLLAMLHG